MEQVYNTNHVFIYIQKTRTLAKTPEYDPQIGEKPNGRNVLQAHQPPTCNI
jgi:hypothetical protein